MARGKPLAEGRNLRRTRQVDEANPGLVKEQPPDDEAVTTVTFFGKKQTEAYKRQIKAAEAFKNQGNK